jgi:hypothetical protein
MKTHFSVLLLLGILSHSPSTQAVNLRSTLKLKTPENELSAIKVEELKSNASSELNEIAQKKQAPIDNKS